MSLWDYIVPEWQSDEQDREYAYMLWNSWGNAGGNLEQIGARFGYDFKTKPRKKADKMYQAVIARRLYRRLLAVECATRAGITPSRISFPKHEDGTFVRHGATFQRTSRNPHLTNSFTDSEWSVLDA